MSRHNYTNPAFCQNSEFYPGANQQQIYNRSLIYSAGDRNEKMFKTARDGPLRIQRSVSTRSFHTPVRRNNVRESQRDSINNELKTPPKPGPKPGEKTNHTSGPFETRSGSGRYALVPVEDLPNERKSSYAIVPEMNTTKSNTRLQFTKSQDNLHQYHTPLPNEVPNDDSSEQYTSLPPIPLFEDQPRMKSAFSSDFGSKFVLVDQKNNQRYAMVPTAEDEELVDDSHEIIQMHNGRTHRYAVIPTDEEETCLSTSDLNQSQNFHDPSLRLPFQTSTPQKQTHNTSYPTTPLKNPAATKMLHELLSTPRKNPAKRSYSVSRNSNQSAPHYYQPEQEFERELYTNRLQYQGVPKTVQRNLQTDTRTTAVITPRVASNADPADDSFNKSWNNSHPQKVANATATLAVVSFMLIVGSTMNSGLCIYMIAHMGKLFYLQFSLAAAFCGVGLGILGFRSRHSEWLPNRSYTSGYILVTVFSLLKCCGLVVLLVLNPYPGLPLHDVTTGVILGLSTFTIFFIGLGVIGSYWCNRPPPDNRVNVIY